MSRRAEECGDKDGEGALTTRRVVTRMQEESTKDHESTEKTRGGIGPVCLHDENKMANRP